MMDGKKAKEKERQGQGKTGTAKAKQRAKAKASATTKNLRVSKDLRTMPSWRGYWVSIVSMNCNKQAACSWPAAGYRRTGYGYATYAARRGVERRARG